MMNFAKTIKCVFIAKITSILKGKKKKKIEQIGRGRGELLNKKK